MLNLQELLFKKNEPFCLINKEESVSDFKGEIREYSFIREFPQLEKRGISYIAILPYNQIKKRGYATLDAGEKIISLMAGWETQCTKKELLEELPEEANEKMLVLYRITGQLLASNFKFLGICLGHQILSRALGLTLIKLIIPLQRMQKRIRFMDKNQYAGFFNSFLP